MLTPNEYQKLALRTANPELTKKEQLLNGILGLGGESGECEDIYKKHLFQVHPLDEQHIIKELGDCCWYIALCAHALGTTLEEIMELNIAKLQARYPDGFDTERSLHRKKGDI